MLFPFLQGKCSKNIVVEDMDGPSAKAIFEQSLNEIGIIQAYNLQSIVSEQHSNALESETENKIYKGQISGFGKQKIIISHHFQTYCLSSA